MQYGIFPTPTLANASGASADPSLLDYKAHMHPPGEQERQYVQEMRKRLQLSSSQLTSLGAYSDFRTAFYKRQYATQLTIFNYTDGPIVAYDRQGLPFVIEPDTRRSGYASSCVVIKKDVLFDNKVVLERTLKVLRALGQLSSADLRAIRNKLENEQNTFGIHGGRIELEYCLSYNDLQQAGGALYHAKTDLLISILGLSETPRHPHSSENTNLGVISSLQADEYDDVGLVLRYINPNQAAKPLYINFANKVFTLIPQAGHPTKTLEATSKAKRTQESVTESDTYIEFIYSARVDGSGNDRELSYTRLGLEEAKDQYGLFDSYGEAINTRAGLESAARKQKEKIEALETELARQKQAQLEVFQIKERELQDKIREKDLQIEELKRANSTKLEVVKEQREGQAHKQKMVFEIVKFVISFSTLLLGIIPMILKLKTPAKA